MQPQIYDVLGHGGKTQILADPAITSHIGRICSPYFNVSAATAALSNRDIWTVCDATLDIGPDYETYEVEPLGEVTSHVAISAINRHVICSAPKSLEWQVQNILRNTRDVHFLMARAHGHFFFHGGLVRWGDQGLLLMGGSRSGKTSLALGIGLRGGVIVSNDSLSLRENRLSVDGYGWPRSVSIRLDTFDRLLPLSSQDALSKIFQHPGNRTIDQLRRTGIEKNGSILAYPCELYKELNIKFSSKSSADIMLFPIFDNDLTDPVLRRLLPEDAYSRLAKLYKLNPVRYANKLATIYESHEPFQEITFPKSFGNIPAYEFRQNFCNLEKNVSWLLDVMR